MYQLELDSLWCGRERAPAALVSIPLDTNMLAMPVIYSVKTNKQFQDFIFHVLRFTFKMSRTQKLNYVATMRIAIPRNELLSWRKWPVANALLCSPPLPVMRLEEGKDKCLNRMGHFQDDWEILIKEERVDSDQSFSWSGTCTWFDPEEGGIPVKNSGLGCLAGMACVLESERVRCANSGRWLAGSRSKSAGAGIFTLCSVGP